MPDDETTENFKNRMGSTKELHNTSSGGVKNEWRGRYMYVPDALNKQIDSEFKRLSYELDRDHDIEIQKNRHYYPVLAKFGVKTIESLDADTFLEHALDIVDSDEFNTDEDDE